MQMWREDSEVQEMITFKLAQVQEEKMERLKNWNIYSSVLFCSFLFCSLSSIIIIQACVISFLWAHFSENEAKEWKEARGTITLPW